MDRKDLLFKTIPIPNGVTEIGDYAFYDCDSLTEITLPESVTKIGYKPFDSDVTLYVPKGSYAETWAKENGMKFKRR